MNFYQRILNAGVRKDTPYDLVVILRTASITNWSLFGAVLFFLSVFVILAPGMVPIMLLALIILITSISLQYFGFHIAGRMITSLCVCGIASTIYGLVSVQSQEPALKIYAISTLFALAPWFLFSVREVAYALVAGIINLMILFFIDDLTADLKINSDITAVGSPVIQNIILAAGVIILSACTLSLQLMNRREAKKGKALLEKLSAENARSVEKEQALNLAIERLTAAQNDEQRRAWATKGMADASRILRTNDAQKVSDELITYLVKCVEANQGALFLLNTEGNDLYFEMKACYAYERKKFIDKKVDVGQGLLGQCYFEKDCIHLTEVPPDYVHITSGLGLATPRGLLIVPLMANEVVVGAMELASFKKFEQHQIDFLMDIGEVIAMTFSNIRVNERTKVLLSETQLMAEQMKSQDEEMRQNMEEIAATQEHQVRIESELREQLAAKDKEIADLSLKMRLAGSRYSQALVSDQ